MAKFEDLMGRVFGKLTVLRMGERDKYNNIRWLCLCECGRETSPRSNALTTGKSTSCGCYGRTRLALGREKHGLSKHPLYRARVAAIQRCYNVKDPNFILYGGRGIKVDSIWLESTVAFIEWGLENGWEKGLDLDRIDNDGDYTPNNCRFISHRQNSGNTRIQKNRNLPVGVRKLKNRFTAHINLGSFLTSEEATLAYLSALRKLEIDS